MIWRSTAGRSAIARSAAVSGASVLAVVLVASCSGGGAPTSSVEIASPEAVAPPSAPPRGSAATAGAAPASSSPRASASAEPEEHWVETVEWAPRARADRQGEMLATLWYDDEVAAQLARNCNWDPHGCIRSSSKSTYFDGQKFDGVSDQCQEYARLACIAIPPQACNPNPCTVEDACYATCSGTCDDCGAKCVKSCESCKASCKDDACRMKCGRGCAVCRGECIKALDDCKSEGCSAEVRRCGKEQEVRWAESTCTKVCPAVELCVQECPGGDHPANFTFFEGACPKSCMKRLGKGCPTEFEPNCMGNGFRSFPVQAPSDE